MHSSRIDHITVSRRICVGRGGLHAMHDPLPHKPPAMHATPAMHTTPHQPCIPPCHTCPPAMHTPLPCTPTPAMYAPCHARPPWTEWLTDRCKNITFAGGNKIGDLIATVLSWKQTLRHNVLPNVFDIPWQSAKSQRFFIKCKSLKTVSNTDEVNCW